MKEKLWIPRMIGKQLGYQGEVLFARGITSPTRRRRSSPLRSRRPHPHPATASGMATTTQGIGRWQQLRADQGDPLPPSLGLLYSAFTYYLGFKVNSAEYKVMERPVRHAEVRPEESSRSRRPCAEDGSFKLNMKYFAYDYG